MLECLSRFFGKTNNPASPSDEFDPVYGLPKPAVEAWSTKRLRPVDLESVSPEETLIDDPRAELTPVEMVDRKLLRLLNGTPSSARHSRRGVRHATNLVGN